MEVNNDPKRDGIPARRDVGLSFWEIFRELTAPLLVPDGRPADIGESLHSSVRYVWLGGVFAAYPEMLGVGLVEHTIGTLNVFGPIGHWPPLFLCGKSYLNLNCSLFSMSAFTTLHPVIC